MKTSYSYPTKVKLDGKIYPINTSTKVGLKCLALSEDTTVSDYERAIGINVMLFGREAPITDESLNKAKRFLQRGEETVVQLERKEDIHLLKDFNYIATSIQTQYAINIRETDIHLWHFIDLIEGLRKTLMNDIREIRNVNTSEIKDVKQRNQIKDLQNHYSLDGKIKVKSLTLKEMYAEIEGSE